MKRERPKRSRERPRCDRCGHAHALSRYQLHDRPADLCDRCARLLMQSGSLRQPAAPATTEAPNA